MSKQILKVLIDLLEQDSDEVLNIYWCISVVFKYLYKFVLDSELTLTDSAYNFVIYLISFVIAIYSVIVKAWEHLHTVLLFI